LAEIPQASPPPAPSSSKKSGFLKIFFIVITLILFGILIGVVAARFFPMTNTAVLPVPTPLQTVTPTSTFSPELTAEQDATLDPTANWKAYTNEVLGISFKYPDSPKWVVGEGRDTVSVQCTGCTNEDIGIYLLAINKLQIVSVTDFKKEAMELGFSDLVDTKLGDLNAVLYLQKGTTQSPTCMGIFVVFMKQGYKIAQCYLDSLTEITMVSNLPKPVPDILSTFKFIDNTDL